MSLLMISIAGQAQNYIQASVKKNINPAKIDIVFRPNYTSIPGEYIHFLQFSLAIPVGISAGVPSFQIQNLLELKSLASGKVKLDSIADQVYKFQTPVTLSSDCCGPLPRATSATRLGMRWRAKKVDFGNTSIRSTFNWKLSTTPEIFPMIPVIVAGSITKMGSSSNTLSISWSQYPAS